MLKAPSIFFLVSVWVSTSAFADKKDTSQELETIKTEINSLEQDLSKSKASKTELYQQLKQRSRAVSALNKELLAIKKEKAKLDNKLTQLEKQAKQHQQSHSQQLEALNEQIRTSFIHGKPSFMKVLLNQHDPATLSRSTAYFRYFNQARQEQLERINHDLANLSTEQKNLYSAQKKQKQLYAKQKQKQNQLKSEAQQRKATLKQLESKISDQGSRLSSLQEQENALQALLKSLNKPKPQPKKVTPSTVKTRPLGNTRFAKRAGSLTWPLRGKLLARYGSARNVGKLKWQGIMISSPAGENIVASASGQVIFSDWLRGFGLLIIIDHGDQYMTLYGNNETLLKQVGDTVSAGELIAQSGDKGVKQHAGLYFEIRHKGSPINPLKWLSKQS